MQEPNAPFFTIVIPYYNRYELAVETVASALDQTFDSYEILIVDDGSTDGSGEKLGEFFRAEKKVRVIRQPNLERGAARNRGLKEGRGEYIVFLDSDDLLLKDHLQTLHEEIAKHSQPDFIATKYEFLRDGKRYPSSTSELKEAEYDYRLFLEGNPLACNVAVRKNNQKLKLFREEKIFSIKEDWMFFIQNLIDQKLYLVDRVTVLHRDHPERSILSDNKALIEKTFLSEQWIIEHVPLSERDQRLLIGQTNYFCAIHSYIDNRRTAALSYLSNAFRKGGMRKKYIVLLAKVLIGRKTIKRFIS